ncbi:MULTISPECIES: class III lanthipeptide [unclassified Thermosipho (in: thermotogales)]|nr:MULTISPECIES: class III lanthipeptide [unclassified Thermosipho (in: thermotogales)]ANQ54579.1 hypothetical protein Y592_03385 [Thermosipho sp. 1070]
MEILRLQQLEVTVKDTSTQLAGSWTSSWSGCCNSSSSKVTD